jgi:arylsulfatase A
MNRWYALVPAMWALAACGETPRTEPPNVVIMFVDDMGYADIGSYGATAYTTPHLDQMAREGERRF